MTVLIFKQQEIVKPNRTLWVRDGVASNTNTKLLDAGTEVHPYRGVKEAKVLPRVNLSLLRVSQVGLHFAGQKTSAGRHDESQTEGHYIGH